MRRRTSTVLAMLAIALAAGHRPAAVDLRNVLNGYSLTSWGINDGLPSSEVLAIAQDIDGFLWLGTDGGLVRFDGTRFTTWSGAPAKRSIRSILVTWNGDLWAGLGEGGGILHYRRTGAGQIQLDRQYGNDDGLGTGAVRALAADGDGTIWAGHLGGLFRFQQGRWTRWTATGLGDAEVHALLVDTDNRLLVGTRRGVLIAAAADRASLAPAAGTSSRDEPVPGLGVDRLGVIWRTDGIHGFNGHVPGRGSLTGTEIGRGQRILHDRAGYVWVGTGGQGLWRVSREPDGSVTVEKSTVTTGLLGNGVVSVFEDREGNIWAGTIDGLNRFTPYVATPVQGLGLVSGVEVSPQGIWVMTAESLLLFPPGPAPTKPVTRHRGDVMAIHADTQGRLWMSTGSQLWRFEENGQRVGPIAVAELGSIGLIAADRQGGLWLYDTERGLHRFVDGRLIEDGLPEELRRIRLTWMDTARDGTLWLATNDQRLVAFTTSGVTTSYGIEDGLDGGIVRAMYEDGDGALWLGGSEGLVRFKDGRFSTLREGHGHDLEFMTAVIEDSGGQLWMGIRSGLLRVSPGDLQRRMAAATAPLPLAHLNKGDGLAGSPRWYGHRGAVRDATGRLWFVTSRGLSVIDPGSIPGPRPVEASVDAVVVDGHTVTGTTSALPPGTRRLEIQFAALALTAPATVRFRYRLEGFDQAWVDAGPRRHAAYTNLAPGPYQFHVMATNTDGTWPNKAAAWKFSVEPMFYQTRAFLAACVLAALGFVALAWRLHLRRVRNEMSILLAERARLAREMHDTLLQGMFGVALRCDAIAAEAESTAPRLHSQLIDLRLGVEQYVREARQSILGLRSAALDRLGLAEALRTTGEQLTAGTRTKFAFQVVGKTRRCQSAAEEHVLRIGQEAITNAVRHAHAATVQIILRYSPDGIELQVADSGQGFDTGSAEHGGGGLGLANIRGRAAAAGGLVRIHSEAGRGTRIELQVPYEHAHATS
jgi:signal transduction histidine kinase/ligand-binding sensor domain-containing protein